MKRDITYFASQKGEHITMDFVVGIRYLKFSFQINIDYGRISLLAGIKRVYDEILQLMVRTRDLWLIVKGISMIPSHLLLEFISQDLYESDNFRMYVYKVQKCSKLYSHDWTSCPFTHQGEKAHRRDPRKYNYLPIPCLDYKFASCIKGGNCELCHGVFEYWLHPAKYKTNPCQVDMSCNRPGISPNPQQIPPKNMSTFELFDQHPPLSSQTHPRFGNNAQNESDFSLFTANHAKLIEQVKNLELGSTSHAKMNKIYDDKGKRSVEYELRDQKISNIN
ncbi:hypothetical protein H5410_028231 [Solanum commersonii]|uniref:AtC3H23-like CCCH zinc finger domain-containing protein n=1 Tax=Solanum commersonii TaxID=4109 RepID=A0A9J5Z1C4_SOLCO|nr:hypothetical protein H5410_028231 [Solanum commersonii]